MRAAEVGGRHGGKERSREPVGWGMARHGRREVVDAGSCGWGKTWRLGEEPAWWGEARQGWLEAPGRASSRTCIGRKKEEE